MKKVRRQRFIKHDIFRGGNQIETFQLMLFHGLDETVGKLPPAFYLFLLYSGKPDKKKEV